MEMLFMLSAHSLAQLVWRSGDEPMYEIPAINRHAAWNDKALIPAQCVLSPRSWGLEFSQGFVCGSTDCTQTMNPLIELQTFQSLRGWVEVWFRLPNIWGYVSSKNTLELLGKYRMLLCFSNYLHNIDGYIVLWKIHINYCSQVWGW